MGREKTFYDRHHFPWKDYVELEGVHQQAHIVFSGIELAEGFQCLGSFKKDQALTLAQFVLLTYVAEALQDVIKFRGCHAGKMCVGPTSRIIVIVNYLTREVFKEEMGHLPLPLEELYNPSNIVGLMFSVFIQDRDLNFTDALSDRYLINQHGEPYKKTRAPGQEEAFGDVVGLVANPPIPVDGAGEMDANPAPVIGRPDIPGEFIDSRRSSYFFPKHNEAHQRLLKVAASKDRSEYKYLNLRSFDALINILSAVSNNNSPVAGTYSNNHLSSLGPDHPILLENLFTLDEALRKINHLDVHPTFRTKDNWVNTRRGMDGRSTFGAPCWGEGPLELEDRGAGERRRFRAGQLDTAACMPLKYFTAHNLTLAWLPHCQITETSLLRADEAMRGTQRMVNGRMMCVDDMLESYGLLTGPRAMKKNEQASLKNDVFNNYFETMGPVEAEIRKQMNSSNPEEGWARLAKLRQQGQHFFQLGNDIESPELPIAYKKLICAVWEQKHWIPKVEHLWQSREVAMSPFAQLKIRQLILFETFVRTSDSQLFLLPILFRAAMSTYMPKVADHLNKENIQMVCSPGTSKSNLINKLIRLLIKGTFEIQGGASEMGLVGEAKSQRLIEIYHELNAMFAPAKDPEGPDASKTHMMLLTMLSEGHKNYKTTEKEVTAKGDETRQHKTISSEETNVRIGARNFRDFHGGQGGTAAAMMDRWTLLTIRPVISDKRVNILVQVLQTSIAMRSTASTRVEKQYKLLQRFIMDFCAGIAYYWLPMPDLSLFSDIAPQMVGWIARMKPQIFSALRQVSSLRTRELCEIIMFIGQKVLFTTVNPTAKIIRLTPDQLAAEELEEEPNVMGVTEKSNERIVFGEYDPAIILPEASKYAYSTMDTVIFTVTEKLFELTGAEGFEIVRGIAERGANYFTLGRGEDDRLCNFNYTPWRPAFEGHFARHAEQFAPWNSTPQLFVDAYLQNAQYYLGVPASSRQAQHQMRAHSFVKTNDTSASTMLGYNSYELLVDEIPEEYKLLFETSAVRDKEPVKIERSERASWKPELYRGRRFWNPNYVRVQGTICSFAKASNGQIGNYKLSASAISDLLTSLSNETMTTPYMPLVLEPDAGVENNQTNVPKFGGHMDLIQSLRYIPGAMDKFPKYRVPPVIPDTNDNCFYILVSYLETDAWKIATDMVEHVCYHGTRPRKTIMGIPSKSGSFLYEAIDIKPVRNKKLSILGKNNTRAASYKILKDYFMEDNQFSSTADNLSCNTAKVYLEEDIESEYCKRYLKTSYPLEDIETLMEKYGPSADPYYGAEGWYARHPEDLHTVAYPEVLLPPPEPIPSQTGQDEPVSMVSPAARLQQQNLRREKRRSDMAYQDTMQQNTEKRSRVPSLEENFGDIF